MSPTPSRKSQVNGTSPPLRTLLPKPSTDNNNTATITTTTSPKKRRRLSPTHTPRPTPPLPPPPRRYTPLTPYGVAIKALQDRHQLHAIAEAERFFARRQDPVYAAECQDLCLEIIEMQPAEAILAKAHAMLAVRGVGDVMPSVRRFNAQEAVKNWNIVVERTGLSRLDPEVAREGLRGAEEFWERAGWWD